MDMPFTTELIDYAKEQEIDTAAWDIWTKCYPLAMAKLLKLESFEKFKNNLFKKQPTGTYKTEREIEQEISAIVAVDKARR